MMNEDFGSLSQKRPSVRRLNRLAQALRSSRYLEIGVNSGETFNLIEITERVAVDPHFTFNFKDFENNGAIFHELTSDEYFAGIGPEVNFDQFFIDGLHTFEQVLRDFCNSLVHSHRRTVWLIDNTMPNDVFSILQAQEDAIRFREATGNKDKSWHGDVFKLVFYIHDFFPSLNYRTITGSGNAQTLVWMSNEDQSSPRFNNLEKISRLTYYDLHDNLDVLRECSEEEALELCIGYLTRHSI